MFHNVRPPSSLRLKPPAPPRHHLGLALSLLLHGLLIGLVVAKGEQLFQRAAGPALFGDLAGASAGGGGGSRVAYITLPSLPKPEPPKPPVVARPKPVVSPPREPPKPVVPPEPAEPVVAPEPVDTAPSVQPTGGLAAADSSKGGGPGTGIRGTGGAGQGSGPGAGPGSGAGRGGGRAYPPEPRDMAFPFDNPPKELRGISLNVTFWVRVDGRVERYVVEPEIKDRDYAKKFDEVMRAFRFTPARAPDGTHVPGTTRISFTLPGKSSS
jgi:hypothetical protein